jgi:hypothetical protein
LAGYLVVDAERVQSIVNLTGATTTLQRGSFMVVIGVELAASNPLASMSACHGRL